MQTRRGFLKWTAAAGGALAVGPHALGQAAEPVSMAIARSTASPQEAEAIQAMAIKLTTQAIDALGGMKRFVKSGDAVWVKPNMAWDRTPELAANTNPDVIATLIKLCFEAGAGKVKVGDFPCHEAKLAYKSSGIADAAEKAGAQVVFLDESRFREMNVGGKILKNWPVYPEIVEADLVINAPLVKTHSIAKMTLCMKNYMGVANDRQKWHQNLPDCLCDITKFMKPRLCVVDAIRILTANGPTGGNLADVKRLDTIAAGTDIVALDAFGATLLGFKPEEISSVVAGQAAGLGTMDYLSLNPKELTVA